MSPAEFNALPDHRYRFVWGNDEEQEIQAKNPVHATRLFVEAHPDVLHWVLWSLTDIYPSAEDVHEELFKQP